MSIKGGYAGMRYVATLENMDLYNFLQMLQTDFLDASVYEIPTNILNSDFYKDLAQRSHKFLCDEYTKNYYNSADELKRDKLAKFLNTGNWLALMNTVLPNQKRITFVMEALSSVGTADIIKYILKYTSDSAIKSPDTITIAYGAGNNKEQIIPCMNSYKNDTCKKRNIVFNFDGFVEDFGNKENIQDLLENWKSYFSSKYSLEVSDVTVNYLIQKINFDLALNKTMHMFYDGLDLEKSIQSIDGFINYCKQRQEKMASVISKMINSEEYNTNIDILNDNDDKVVGHIIKFKLSDGTQFMIFNVYKDIIVAQLEDIVRQAAGKNVYVVCSVRKVDCICDYISIVNIDAVDKLYIAHGTGNTGYISYIDGKEFAQLRNTDNALLNVDKKGASNILNDVFARNTISDAKLTV